jgi:FSR family fosmidomycin resistance protein-like MFS transporter
MAEREINASSLSIAEAAPPPGSLSGQTVAVSILLSISFCHLLNDMMQSLITAVYPILKTSFHLGFAQLGLITLTFQFTASLLQPVVGQFTDRKPQPYSLVFGMCATFVGLLLLAFAPVFGSIVFAASLVGLGSSIFHPESSRVARLASGGQHGLAQSVFQVGGNAGSALGPLLAALVVLPGGQTRIAWFSAAALVGAAILYRVGGWYKAHLLQKRAAKKSEAIHNLSPRKVTVSLAILAALIFSKYFYLASLTNYFMFYLIDRFHISVAQAQYHLFIFLGAVALGTIAGGPVGDSIGRKSVIWVSILGILPFTLLMPHVNLFWTTVLSFVIGLILASAFSAILVYAQELVPGRVGMISGLFFGFAFGMAGVGAALLGVLADHTSVNFVYQVCAFLPAIGLLTAFLPNLKRREV